MRRGYMKNWRWHLLFAAIAGLALRLFFVLHFPASSGDTPIYEELATNWLKHGVYGLSAEGRVMPSDMRMPGYPAFLAAIYALTGKTGPAARLFVMLAQAIVDLGTCFVSAALAGTLAPKAQRRWMGIVALWLAATCPFVANYAAVPLTETLTICFTALALFMFVTSLKNAETGNTRDRDNVDLKTKRLAILGALLTGIATLLRPESPLLLIAFFLVLVWYWRHPQAWRRLALAGAAIAFFFLIPLLPWAARNAVTLHKMQFLAPRYAQLPSEIVPMGFYAWERTWLVRMRDAYLVSWKLDEEEIRIADIPSSAFDSADERERVARLLATHNRANALSKAVDDGFAKLAVERAVRHPLRTYLWVPLRRVATIWFTPRIELLPYSGNVFPVASNWGDDPVDFSVTAGFFLLNVAYVILAIIGARRVLHYFDSKWRSREFTSTQRAIALIAVFIVIRTAFLTAVEIPEPRYVLECFPALLALAAFSFLPRVPGEL